LKKYILIGGGIVTIIILVYLVSGVAGSSSPIPTARVSNGNFVVSLAENGRLNAQRSMTISAPRIRGSLQIVSLAPEGSMVKEGDFLVQFDPVEQETRLRDTKSELKIAEADLERAKGQMEMDLKQLELELKKAQRAYSEKQSEAPIIRKEAELELQLAELKHDTQKKMLEADIRKKQVGVDKARETLEGATRDLEKMTIKAPIPGLVVYMEIWKGGNMEKVQEGDSPWGGQGLINLPDLSTMIVETTVSEVDVSKIAVGQKAEISLDAIPGPVFSGTVTEISTLAHRKERGSQINVFDVEVQVDSVDQRLKPGMSAKVDIIVDNFNDVLSVPIEAVFERDDTTIVFTKSGKKIPVSLGARNDNSVIVEAGLDEGDEVALVDPTRKVEEGGDRGQGTEAGQKPRKGSKKTTTQTIIIGG